MAPWEAFSFVACAGEIVVFPHPLPISTEAGGRTLVGSRCGRFEPALRLLAAKKIDVADLIDEEFSLDQAPAAFQRAAAKGVLKVLPRPPEN